MSIATRAHRSRSVCSVVAIAALAACAPSGRRETGVEPEDSSVAPDASPDVTTAPMDAAPDVIVAPPDAPPLDATVTPPDGAPDVLPDVAVDAALEAASEVGPDAPSVTCTGGLRACSGRCVDIASDRTNCGGCNTACMNSAHSTSACNAGECENTCDTGYADCDGMLATGCETTLDTPEHCGSCTRRCTTGQVCAAGACVGAEMAPPPRLYEPTSGSRVARRRPELEFFPVAGAGGTQVQVCRTRACNADQIVATADSTTNRVALTTDLAPGVYFWRARSGAPGRYGATWTPVWQFRVPHRDGMANIPWGAEPDFNGDGYADIAVGAPDRNMNTGAAYVYFGSSTGPATTPGWSQNGFDGVNADFGFSVGAAGDVNGDGFVDLAVSASEGGFAAGRVYIYFGSASGLATSPSFTVSGPEGLSNMGESVGAMGDVNGDGYADFATGAPINGGFAQGIAYLYLGRASGAITSPAQAFRSTPVIEAHAFGNALSPAGDVNGDGFMDMLVGARGRSDTQSAVYLFTGTPTMFGATASTILRGAGTAEMPVVGQYFGVSVAGIGDVNNDGYHDVMVGAAGGSNFDGYARVYLGSASGLLTAAAWERRGSGGARLGLSVSGGGDVNGDGFDDVMYVSAGTGRVRVVYGSVTGPSGDGVELTSAGGDVNLGAFKVAVVGDVDGDGYVDVAVGGPDYNGGRGRVFMFRGGAMGIATGFSWTVEGTDAGSRFGAALGRW